MPADTLAPVPRRLLGLTVLVLVLALLGLCVAVYNKVFTSTVPVTVRMDRAGNSLLPSAEVRLRGVTVGEVSSISTDGSGATVELALRPDMVRFIPSNVAVRLLPKSLFGERFVALEPPAHPAPTPIRAGAVIGPDRSGDAIEVEQVLANLLPVLRAVSPADLADALGGVNQALSGRGAQLGDTITLLHRYLAQVNPALPDLSADIAAVPRLTDTYSSAAPDLIEGLADLTTTSRTLVARRGQLARLLSTGTTASDDLRVFLEQNRSNLINLVSTARPTLELLARYSPEYVCLFQRLAGAIPLGKTAFGQGTPRPALRVTLEIVANRGPYRPHQDEPDFTDNRGPACYNNTPPLPQYPGGEYQDGATHPPASPRASQLDQLFGNLLNLGGLAGTGTAGGATAPKGAAAPGTGHTEGAASPGPALPGLPLLGGLGSDTTNSGKTNSGKTGSGKANSDGKAGDSKTGDESGDQPQALGAPAPASAVTAAAVTSIANSAPERELVAGLVADVTGTDRASVPNWASLLVGPLLRGVEVQVR